jgi:hypothetical protein
MRRNTELPLSRQLPACGWSGTSSAPLAKVNYRIHTDAIKETLLPAEVTKAQAATVYANEADLLNVALFDRLTHH